MPVFSAERCLACGLESLLGQSYGDFELIVSDNVSTDATEEICREYARADRRIRCVRQSENRGAVWSLDEVFRLARGELFKWAAYDDECRPQFLGRCVSVLDSDPGIVWFHSWTNPLTGEGAVVPGQEAPAVPQGKTAHRVIQVEPHGSQATRSSLTTSQRFAAVLLGTTRCSDCYGVIRPDALRKTRLILPCYGAEKGLIAELSLPGRFGEVPERLFLQRVHPLAAGELTSAGQQAEHMQPGAMGSRFSSTRLRLLRGFATATWRAELPPAERFRCLAVVARYVLQARKWRRVASQMPLGRGIREPHPTCRDYQTLLLRNSP